MYWDRGCTWKSVPNRGNSMQTLWLEKRMTESRRRIKGLKMIDKAWRHGGWGVLL